MANTINILLTAAGTQTFANVYSALKKQNEVNFRVIACDIDSLAYGLYLADKGYTIPKYSSKEFIPAIVDICRKEHISIIFPLLSAEYPKFAAEKSLFQTHGVVVPISESKTIDICSDKKKTYDFFMQCDIPTPKTYLPEELPLQLTFPMIIKPRTSSGAKNVFKVENIDELQKYLAIVDGPIIQEYVQGQEYTVDTFSNLDSIPIGIVPRTRLDVMDGKSVKGRTVKDQKLTAYIKKIIKTLNLLVQVIFSVLKSDLNLFSLK